MKYKKYFFFFIFVIILLISLNDYKKEEKLYHIQQQSIKKIDNINIKSPVLGTVKKPLKDNVLTFRYTYDGLGLLILPNKIKLNIKKDSSKKTLDSLAVGLVNGSDDIKDKNGSIIIAGHNMKKVFNYLHKIKRNENIIIYTNEFIETFKVVNKQTIKETDYSHFKKQNKKVLYLITCTKKEKERLLVTALLDKEQECQ